MEKMIFMAAILWSVPALGASKVTMTASISAVDAVSTQDTGECDVQVIDGMINLRVGAGQ